MVFGRDGSCGAEVTFQAASEWVFGRRFDVSDRDFTLKVFLEPMVPLQTTPKLLQNAPKNTFK